MLRLSCTLGIQFRDAISAIAPSKSERCVFLQLPEDLRDTVLCIRAVAKVSLRARNCPRASEGEGEARVALERTRSTHSLTVRVSRVDGDRRVPAGTRTRSYRVPAFTQATQSYMPFRGLHRPIVIIIRRVASLPPDDANALRELVKRSAQKSAGQQGRAGAKTREERLRDARDALRRPKLASQPYRMAKKLRSSITRVGSSIWVVHIRITYIKLD